jgi:lysophospholipase L1-like esterase
LLEEVTGGYSELRMPASRSRAKTLIFVCALTLLGSTGLVLAAEVVVRIKYTLMHKDPGYLVLGILGDYRRGAPRVTEDTAAPARKAKVAPKRAEPVPRALSFTIPRDHDSTQWNDCSQREIFFRVNAAGGRGPAWSETKPAGTIRLLALGESSTFGAGNPEDQTWPALLEKSLREKHGVNAEVLNFGIPGMRIEAMVAHLPSILDQFHPDVVVHYGGYNETWVDAQVPQFLGFLHYRSMLYTYLEEKAHFRAETSALRLVPDTRTYETAFRTLLGQVRARGARLVVVSQAQPAGATPREGTLCARNWRDQKTVGPCLEQLMGQPDRYSRLVRSRIYKTVVLQQVLADVAAAEHLLVIDPRAALVERDDSRRLFCDEIHLTDQGNAVLAGVIAGPLAEYLKPPAAGKPGS